MQKVYFVQLAISPVFLLSTVINMPELAAGMYAGLRGLSCALPCGWLVSTVDAYRLLVFVYKIKPRRAELHKLLGYV